MLAPDNLKFHYLKIHFALRLMGSLFKVQVYVF